MLAQVSQPPSGWRALGLFWAAILLFVAIGAGTLQLLGPPKGLEPAASHDEGHGPAQAHGHEPAATPSVRTGEILGPQAALLEPSKAFAPAMLPRIAPDGRSARLVYARPVEAADGRPRIALLVTGLGMSDADSKAAIQTLPPAVSLAFNPYAPSPEALAQLCRTTGHEMLVSLPLEPQGFPLNDAGSRSLLTGASVQQNTTNLEWAFTRLQGYVGVTGALDGMRGERYAEQTSSWKAMLGEIGRRGLLYIDPRTGKPSDALADVPGRAVDLVIDDPPARAEIEAKLANLERLAREKGAVIGLAGPLRPVTIERIAAWARGLDARGIALVPVSALVGNEK